MQENNNKCDFCCQKSLIAGQEIAITSSKPYNSIPLWRKKSRRRIDNSPNHGDMPASEANTLPQIYLISSKITAAKGIAKTAPVIPHK